MYNVRIMCVAYQPILLCNSKIMLWMGCVMLYSYIFIYNKINPFDLILNVKVNFSWCILQNMLNTLIAFRTMTSYGTVVIWICVYRVRYRAKNGHYEHVLFLLLFSTVKSLCLPVYTAHLTRKTEWSFTLKFWAIRESDIEGDDSLIVEGLIVDS